MSEFQTYTLPNGIRCIFKRIKSPVAYTAMTINAGSRDELKGEYGAAHFAEHSLFKGTRRRKAYHINNRLEKLGGELNAFTTKEDTVIHATTLRGDMPKALELISDVVFESVFPEKEIEREREVILDEINSYKDSPPERIYDEFEEMLFAGSALGHNILGTKASVSRFKGRDIEAFTKRCYNTDEMVLAVAAQMSPEAFFRHAERFFAGRERSPRGFERQAPAKTDVFRKAVNRNNHQAHCMMGSMACGHSDPDRVPLSLLVNVLGGPAANSMLGTLLREKNGLTYNIEASYTPYTDTGIASIYFGTDKDRIDDCIGLTQSVLAKLKTDGLTPRQLSMAKKQYIGQLSIAMESKEGYLLGAGKSYLVYGEIDPPEAIYRKIAEVTPGDVVRVAREVFSDMSYLIYK